ncbi:hypothetical protein HK104_006626 [Borealophlyctis nickersoniae]|nr:hypothetical protein HK104_006626 [Borealophlyctis nickersoniae]
MPHIFSPATVRAKPLPEGAPPRPLFAYGTLMSDRVYARVVGKRLGQKFTPPHCEPAIIHGYRRVCVKGATYPGLIPSTPSSTVEGVLIHVTSHDEVALLDAFESDSYARHTVHVHPLHAISTLPPPDPSPSSRSSSTHTLSSGVEADVYIWDEGEDLLDLDSEWDYETFVKDRMSKWINEEVPGSPNGSEAAVAVARDWDQAAV